MGWWKQGSINAGLIRETDLGVIPKPQPNLIALYKVVLIQKESSAFFGKYLYPSLLKQDPRYYPSTSRNFLGRATYAASRILITRNDCGERRPNTSYFLGVLTSVAIATAYRPYWTRSASTTFKTLVRRLAATREPTSSMSLGLASGK
jgi:hypothetical protein